MRLMQFSPKIHPISGINKFFLSVLESLTQIGFVGVINQEPNISCLGPFNVNIEINKLMSDKRIKAN